MKYKLQIGRDNRIYGLDRVEFEAGEYIEFSVAFLTDSHISVTSEDADVCMKGYDETKSKNIYSFTMPEKDVVINVSVKNDMMINSPQNPMMMAFGNGQPPMLGGMSAFQSVQQSSSGTGKKKFCGACGTLLENENQKFCQNCGAPQSNSANLQ